MNVGNVLIVLGMHRSGTSLIAGWLSKCNLNMGNRLGQPDVSNKLGHFEDLDFLELHQQLLSSKNLSDRALIPPFEFNLSNKDIQLIHELVKRKISTNKQWGWKDPRTCLFIPYYQAILPQAKYLLLYRDYVFVVESLLRRDMERMLARYRKLTATEKTKQARAFEQEAASIMALANTYLTTWIVYNENILKLTETTDPSNYILSKYNNFIDLDMVIFERICSWDFDLNYSPFTEIFDNELINKDLPDLLFDHKLEEKAKEITGRLEALAQQSLLFF